jgi:hypothetical protein
MKLISLSPGTGPWRARLAELYLAGRDRFASRFRPDGDRGDVSGWVLVTLMTAGLVVTIWAVAGPRFEGVFNDAMDRVVGGP